MFKNREEKSTIHTKTVKGLEIILSLFVLFIILIFSAFIGPVDIPIKTIFAIFLKQIPFVGNYVPVHVTTVQYEIITLLREPEIIGAIVVGASLGIGGAAVQSLFRNPITEPYIIGISSGAALGAVMAIVLGITFLGLYTLQILAFAFSMLVVFIVYSFSFRNGRIPTTYLLLIGIGISLFVSSIVALLLYMNIKLQSQAFFWLMGSLQNITWGELVPVAFLVIVTSLIVSAYYKELDAIQMGEAYAHSIGVSVEKTKLAMLTLISLSVSAAVSISGLIGFVGLIIPHISRMIYGGSNKFVLPSSAILGAIFLLLSDDLARTIAGGQAIPIGIITGLVGTPFFLYLLKKVSGGRYDN